MKIRVLICFMAAGFTLFSGQGIVSAKNSAAASNPNQLQSVPSLNGEYIVIRHGESVPSSEKRVCATMESGVDPKNGLTPKGREEVAQSSEVWIEANKKLLTTYLKHDRLVVVTSPFSRTVESAQIFVEVLQKKLPDIIPAKYGKKGMVSSIVVENDIRERNFGKFEGELNSGKIYDQVWEEDRKDPTHTKWGVESTASVQARTSKVIAKLDKESEAIGGKLYILVAHGDTLKIMQTAFQKQSPAEHCNKDSVAPFKTAEIRQMQLVDGSSQAQK